MITKEQAIEAAARYLETSQEEDARIVAEYMCEDEDEDEVQCMHLIPNSKRCAKDYGEGPDAVKGGDGK